MPNHVLITRQLPPRAMAMLLASGEHLDVWEEDRPIPADVLLERLPGARGLLSALTDRIGPEQMERASRLRVIANWAVGYDNIDVAAATERGIRVGNTPDVLTETSADLAFGLLLAVARRIPEADRYVREGRWGAWDPNLLLGTDVGGATIGIVGMGRIGQAMARRAHGFGMRVLYWSRQRRPADEERIGGWSWRDLPSLLAEADFVSLHCALTPETRHLIDAAALARMRPSAYLINAGRGPLVDQAALVGALHRGTIAGAALDVTDPEPTPLGDPLLAAPNLVIAPHIASATALTRSRMAERAADNLLAGLRGESLPFPVN